MNYASLFTGIGGFELGLGQNFKPVLQNEIAEAARKVIESRFPNVTLHPDIQDLNPSQIRQADMLVGGFPCQDVSIVGGQKGMGGSRTVLVEHVFRLAAHRKPDWIFLENVQSIRFVHGGRALFYLISESEKLGYRWAYRTLDSHAFGLPQRRRRLYFLASKVSDPGEVLFSESGPQIPKEQMLAKRPIGFYWTEGRAGHGLTADAIPPLKAGSSIGIPSPPAVLFPDGVVRVPTIETAEALQGFPAGWSAAASERERWRLVGNAVSPPVISWIASKLRAPATCSVETSDFPNAAIWPLAGQGSPRRQRRSVHISETPEDPQFGRLSDSEYQWKTISVRALAGFYARAESSSLNYPKGFLDRIAKALKRLQK